MRRVGIAGCGAVTQIYYGPALRELESSGRLELAGVFDPDAASAAKFADGFYNAMVATTFEDLLEGELDLIVLASPPRFHCEQALAALGRGIRVHCEKPLATTLVDGQRMVAAAKAAGISLSVGMIRRRLAPAQFIQRLLSRGAIGPLNSIEIFEGGPFRWPISSPAYFDREAGAGGVLEDIGSHVLDLLCWWLGPPDDVHYSDDALGGVAANCSIELRFGTTAANVRLSRDWHRPNLWRLSGERGAICWDVDEWDKLELAMGPAERASRVSIEELVGNERGPPARAALTFEQAFADQLATLLNGEGEGAYVSAAEALPVLHIFERCDQVRTQMDMPWLV